jgi:tRNA/rRNA methyltransferase
VYRRRGQHRFCEELTKQVEDERPAMRAATMAQILPAKTDKTPMKTRFILLNTSHAGNVGAAARAMKVMGFSDLVLVAPRWDNVLRREETIQRASGALDVLANARVVATLDEAIDGLHHLCATAMTPRDFGPPTLEPRPHFAALAAEHRQNDDFGVGFLFGSERFGMRNEDVYRCHTCLSIPTDPKFGSLNLGAAVQVLAYDWREALGGLATMLPPVDVGTASGAALAAQEPTRLADAQQLAGLLGHLEQSLKDIGFLDPEAPKKLMPRLNQLFNRAQVTQEEIHILRGIAKTMSQVAKTKAEKSKG